MPHPAQDRSPRTSRPRARPPARPPLWLSRVYLSLALGVGAVSLGFAVDALVEPASILWDTAEEQTGQFVFYNFRENGGHFGLPVEMGDYDGDGLPDLVIAPMGAEADGTRPLAGEVYVMKGTGEVTGSLERGNFTNATFPGLTVMGARRFDFLGTELYTADVNGDGIDDLLVSSQNYDGPTGVDGERLTAGGVFVILGRPDLLETGSVLDLLFDPASPPPGVITIVGERAGDRLGVWVEAGDLDGDGFDDILMGADQSAGADPALQKENVGMAAVIYGREEFPAIIDLADGPEALPGMAFIYGRDPGDHFGSSLHARDLDGDGLAEFIIAASVHRLSASQADPPRRPGDAEGLGAADGLDEKTCEAGEVTVIFSDPGNPRLSGRVDLCAAVPAVIAPTICSAGRTERCSELPAELASRIGWIHGEGSFDVVGEELATGDLDGDGKNELVLGALSASPGGVFFAGAAYVIYGADALRGQVLDLKNPEAFPVEGLHISRLFGAEESDIFGDTLSIGDLNHDGFDDLAVGIPHNALGDREDSGIVAVLFGRPERFPDMYRPGLGELPDGPLLALVRGPDPFDNFSYSMEIRDYNRDGYEDLWVNAMRGDGARNLDFDPGEVHLISGFHLSGAELHIERVEPQFGKLDIPVDVTVRGGGFTVAGDTEIRVGGAAVEAFEIVSGEEIRATFPAVSSPSVVPVTITNRYGSFTREQAFAYVDDDSFVRGDSNSDAVIDIADPVSTLLHMFLGEPATCLDAHDSDDDGELTINDPVRTLRYLFLGGPGPRPPFPDPGEDPTADPLSCP